MTTRGAARGPGSRSPQPVRPREQTRPGVPPQKAPGTFRMLPLEFVELSPEVVGITELSPLSITEIPQAMRGVVGAR